MIFKKAASPRNLAGMAAPVLEAKWVEKYPIVSHRGWEGWTEIDWSG